MASLSVRALLATLIDYAGLYPPAQLEMQSAVSEYDEERRSASAWMLGRFIVSESRIDELIQEIESYRRGAASTLESYAVSVIVDAAVGTQPWLARMQMLLEQLVTRMESGSSPIAARVSLQALEIPLPRLTSQRDTYDAMIGQFAALTSRFNVRHLPTYIELPRDERWQDGLTHAMTVLARYHCSAKVRCGGVTADAFPSPEELAAFIVAATEAQVPFKATAGLHHPVRALDPAGTGFMMHGFLNVLFATLLARDGADAITVEAVIGEEDAAAFRVDTETICWRDRFFDVASIEAMRREGFVAYGSCSISEPIEDLTAMGILTTPL